eukprot:TRINITY_DN24931_c0_g1_i1.p1 TRINITY_DN24931_c0_g1~~TRINITY_DN24931_c0_g1_i1.p1  ORF type:complete len:298 (+),score=66.06 TRINITY_DN24931_c0_g1_i1:33-926(+)
MSSQEKEVLFRFGLFADAQYSEIEDDVKKHNNYKDALRKIDKGFEFWRGFKDLKFGFQLGDIINGRNQPESGEDSLVELDAVLNLIKSHSPVPVHHVVGNHCLSIPKPKSFFLEKLGLASGGYYVSHNLEGFKIIVLDGTDIGVMSNPEGSPKYKEALEWLANFPPNEERPYMVDWNAAIGKDQIEWLTTQLDLSRKDKEKVIILCHYPTLTSKRHKLWNKDEILHLLENYQDVVVAYITGHYHKGDYKKQGKIHHLTLNALLTARPDSTAFAVVEVQPNGLNIKGSGDIKDIFLEI